ncbi:hypothetical protein N7456_005444 [Penicillium angulare]|uniref:Hydrophobin n=1 Tax=Penicillium angulare TaxID=116970 RepID=A0A9W9FYJ6_9EURO|nr:hypothetical protein N7456_005444 [Penicillium angulare]
MKTSMFLLVASAGLTLAQPASLGERADTVCQSGNGNPLEPTPACCYYMSWTKEHLPYSVCMAPSSSKNTAEFNESCKKIKADAKPQCCPKTLITDDETKNIGDDFLCTAPRTVA